MRPTCDDFWVPLTHTHTRARALPVAANVARCEICGFKAPRTRIGMKVNGRFVLVSVHRDKDQNEFIRIFDATHDIMYTESGLIKSDEHLEIRMRRTARKAITLHDAEAATLRPRGGKEAPLQLVETEPADASTTPSAASPSLTPKVQDAAVRHRPWSQHNTRNYARLGIDATEDELANESALLRRDPAEDTSSATASAPATRNGKEGDGGDGNGGDSDSDTHTDRTQRTQRTAARVGRGGKGAPAPPSSLFDKVMSGANDLVYDSHIGQYVEKSKLDAGVLASPTRETNDEGSLDGEETLHGLIKEFQYVKHMRKERDIMRNTIQTKKENGKLPDMGPTSASFHDTPFSDRGEDRTKHRAPCALCEFPFPVVSLMGQVPFNAVVQWRARHGNPIPESDPRLDVHSRYETARICAYCTQFFDKNFTDYVEYHKGTTGVADPVLEIETEEDKDTTTKPKFDLEGLKKARAQVSARPLDQSIAMLRLRNMRDKPLLMEQVRPRTRAPLILLWST